MTTSVQQRPTAFIIQPSSATTKDSGIYSEATHSCSSMASSSGSGGHNSARSSTSSGHHHHRLHPNYVPQQRYPTRSRASVTSQTSVSSTRTSDNRLLWDAERNVSYEKLRLIGKGGFASVYQVRNLSTGDVMTAAKVIDKKFVENSQQKARVRNEIAIHSTVSHHPNILQFRGSFKSGDNICILSELCSKSTLVHYLRKPRGTDEPEVVRVFGQIVNGVRHLHESGVIHRDLKLANILQTADRQVKIGDFGMAIFAGDRPTNSVCGTPNFIAPEVLRKEGHSFKSDIWSLGCLLYGLLMGRYPFAANSVRETYKKITKCRYDVPTSLSSEACNLIQLLLTPDPELRPTADQILKHEFFSKYSTQKSEKQSQCEKELKLSSSSEDSDFGAYKPMLDRLCSRIKRIASSSVSRKSSETSEVRTAAEGPVSSGNCSPPVIGANVGVYITYWVDYSNRYGFGYRLSDGKICVLFNDGKHLSLFPKSKIMEYFPTEKCGKGIRFNISSSPAPLQRYIRSFAKIAEYLDDAPVPTLKQDSANDVRLMTWVRNDDCVVMYLNCGTLQFKFFDDGHKMLISNLHHKSKMRLHQVDKSDNNNISVSNPIDVRSITDLTRNRLCTVHHLFHDKLFNVSCNGTHPLCDVVRDFHR